MSGHLLIIGGTGFIGRHLTVRALGAGYAITVLSLCPPKANMQIEGANYLQANINDRSQLKAVLSPGNFDYVVNLSGYIDHRSFLSGGGEVINSHFNGVQNILNAINWNVIRRFVQIGSSDEYGNSIAPQYENLRELPISPYSVAKASSTHLLEMLYRTENFPSVVLRFFLVYGPGQDNKRFIPQIINGCISDNSFPVSEGKQLRDFCYIDDVTGAILKVLNNDKVMGETINIASGQPVSIHDVIELIRTTIGKGAPDYGKIPYRRGENMALYANIGKAQEILGWSPKIGLKEGIVRTINSIWDKS